MTELITDSTAARPTQTGVGFSENSDSYTAGREAATLALVSGNLSGSDVALLFCTSRHQPAEVIEGARSVIGAQTEIIGGYAIGIITNDKLGYDGYQVGIALISSRSAHFDFFIEPGLPSNEENVGRALGAAIAAKSYEGESSVLVLYDSLKVAAQKAELNMATPLLEGLRHHLAPNGFWPQLAGAGLCGDTPSVPVLQWQRGEITCQSAMAMVVSGGARMDTVVMHGCKPAGAYHTVTKSDGPVVLEIDDRPALDVIHELLGPDSGYTAADYRFFVTLGVNKGEKFGPYREQDYANRLCCGVDIERGGLVMFEPDLVPGTEVRLMRRSVDFSYIQRRTHDLLARLEGRRPFFALYIDCAGRASAYCGSEGEEAAEVQRALGDSIPLLGFYTGVEIAPVGPAPEPLDWSGVLCVFSE